jgi:hypothetical protein
MVYMAKTQKTYEAKLKGLEAHAPLVISGSLLILLGLFDASNVGDFLFGYIFAGLGILILVLGVIFFVFKSSNK